MKYNSIEQVKQHYKRIAKTLDSNILYLWSVSNTSESEKTIEALKAIIQDCRRWQHECSSPKLYHWRKERTNIRSAIHDIRIMQIRLKSKAN